LKDDFEISYAEVQSVSREQRTCSCTTIGTNAEIDFPEVRLMAEVDDGFLKIPAVGSTVLIGYSKRVAPFVLLFSELDEVQVISGAAGFQLRKDGTIALNDGAFGGLVQVEKLVERLNAIEEALADLMLKYNTHVHASSGAPTTMLSEKLVVPTQRQQIENTQVTHGV